MSSSISSKPGVAAPSFRISLPPTTLFLCALALAYALPGLFGHDPWKPEDAIGAGIVVQMLSHGQWLLPHLAGGLYVDDGPFYYWIAALCAKLASFALGMDDGARLASAAFVIAMLMLLRAAARELYGRAQADASMLVLLGSLGLLVHAHELLGELGMLFGQALALYGIAIAPRKPRKGALGLGLGLAAAVLSKGPLYAIAPAAAALLVWPLSSRWRTRSYALTLGGAVIACLVPLGLWAAVLAVREPAEGLAWYAAQWPEFAAPALQNVLYQLQVLSWSAWPAWPIALWLLWDRRRMLREPGLRFVLLATAAWLCLLLLTRDTREVQSLAVLLPLALLAGPGVERLRRGAVNALVWFGGMSFTFFAGLVWLGWFAMMTGAPQSFAKSFTRLEPGFAPSFQWLPFLIALAFTAAWIMVLFRSDARSPYRSVFYWACGSTLLWCLIMTLWLGWIDYGKSYRPVAASLSGALARAFPHGVPCIEGRNLGESQRGALDYHAGIVTLRTGSRGAKRCPALLVQARPGEDDAVAPGWRRIWEGNRPRDHERYRLYVRTP